jgi:chemotaxis protein CheX
MTMLDLPQDVSGDQVVSIAQDVWESFLSLTLLPHPLGDAAPDITGPTLTGCVSVSGSWAGSVFLQCGADQAREAAEAMFGAEPGDLSDEEVSDALGELTNMVGGNIKSLLPAPSQLSLPSVAAGESYTVRVPGAVLISRSALLCGTGTLTICVWKAASP